MADFENYVKSSLENDELDRQHEVSRFLRFSNLVFGRRTTSILSSLGVRTSRNSFVCDPLREIVKRNIEFRVIGVLVETVRDFL